MENNYYYLLKRVREIRKQYKDLDIEEKLNLLNIEIKLEGKMLQAKDFHTKREKQNAKEDIATRRRIKDKNRRR